ncbi:MAG: hypothetical protein HWE19_01635 [Vibrionaceae bacterium]|nr:hypothetical protein [Vibrionaceae bacterium]
MRVLILFLVSITLSFSTFASTTSGTEQGPLVDCKTQDNQTDYIPLEVCRRSGGKY